MNLIQGTIYKWYKDTPILSGIEVTIQEGEIYQVMGHDDYTKQTLLEVLAKVDRNRLNALDYAIELTDIVYVPRKLAYYFWMTPKGLLSFYQKTRKNFYKETAENWLKYQKFPLKKPIVFLSSQEKKLLAIALAMYTKGKVYVIDTLYTQDSTINAKIDEVLNPSPHVAYVINEKEPTRFATKWITIVDHNQVKMEDAK